VTSGKIDIVSGHAEIIYAGGRYNDELVLF